MTTGGATTTYTYDAVNRLTGAVSPTQNYQYTYNAVDELTNLGAITLGYDANGNETGRLAALSGFGYNAKNQTTSIIPQGGSVRSATYAGDSQHERVGFDTKGFVHSALGLASEQVGSGTSTYYTRDNGGRLVGERTGTSNYYYLFDGLGSVVALTDNTGAAVDTYAYDPYGQVTPGATNSVANP